MTPSIKSAFVAAALLLAVALAYAYGQHQFGLGEQAERAAWLKRENAELTAANANIKALEEKYRQQEHDAADAIAVISFKYQEDLKHVKSEKDRVIAGLRGGAFRLRVPVAATSAACGDSAPEAASAPGGRDGGARAELSVTASEFLVGLASDADEVVRQLTRCQEVIIEDRKHGEQ